MAQRVYELAKELNIQSKDVIGFLAEKNINKKNMSNLDDSEITMVKNKFAKKENPTITKSEQEK